MSKILVKAKPPIIEAEQFVWPSDKPIEHNSKWNDSPVGCDSNGIHASVRSTNNAQLRVNDGQWLVITNGIASVLSDEAFHTAFEEETV